MTTSSFSDAHQFSSILHSDPSLSPSLKVRDTPDPLLSYTVSNIHNLVLCSEERRHYHHKLLPNLPSFVRHIYFRCRLTPSVLVVALIYLERLKRNLPSQAQGEYDTHYKLFLAAVLIASKFLEDCNTHAASIFKVVSPVYTPRELKEMERSFLGVLKFDLYVDLMEMYKFIYDHQESLELELEINN
ncbi:hypothetical protein DFQ28_003435 [Apophysomyces sp. BC1034]|nr:hypothetical protein DFQ30_001458 [Apophysomyces sp. BC1015]KAG0182956.1 hypothetical protein DFQ29_001100 [Apophysomyces sp. BC1021]KAG0193764.1 hypothetical protein DFQ28_003435 [Apophysomyces sp. BC1034]